MYGSLRIIDADALLRSLIRQYGDDIAAEALYQMWAQCGAVEPAYARMVAATLSDRHYRDSLPPQHTTFEVVTRNGELLWSHAPEQQVLTPEDLLLQQKEPDDETHEALRQQEAQRLAQQQLLEVPAWVVQIHIAHQRLQELSRVIRNIAPLARYWGMPQPAPRSRGAPRIWPVRIQKPRHRGRSRHEGYRHPEGCGPYILPLSNSRVHFIPVGQNRKYGMRPSKLPSLKIPGKTTRGRPTLRSDQRLYDRAGAGGRLIPQEERRAHWGLCAPKKKWVPWGEDENGNGSTA